MVWSFLWRFVLYAGALANISTFATGYVMGHFGATHVQVLEAGRVVQVLAILLGAASAYLNARDANARPA